MCRAVGFAHVSINKLNFATPAVDPNKQKYRFTKITYNIYVNKYTYTRNTAHFRTWLMNTKFAWPYVHIYSKLAHAMPCS